MADYDSVSQAFEEKNLDSDESDLVYLPNILVPINDADTARKILHLIEILDNLEDVKAVHSNLDIADDLLLGGE